MKKISNILLNWKTVIPVFWLFIFVPHQSYALDVTLQWDANTEPDLAGYKIYYDTDSGVPYEGTGATEGNTPIEMSPGQDENADPDIVEFTVHNLQDGVTYYFAVTARDDQGLESDYSNEVNTGDNTSPTSAITSPTNNSTFTEGEAINFSGTGDDFEDGPLSGSSSLVWTSSIDGQIGTGTSFVKSDFSLGMHIITLTATDSLGATGNTSVNITVEPATSSDSDGDGMPDWWEEQYGLNPNVDDSYVDTDNDNLNNLQEYQNNTYPDDPDTDADSLPDGWEVMYSLDPNDNSGTNGGDGDPDDDGWTNYEEYLNSSDPTDDISPSPTPPEIVETIPHDSAGIADTTRVPNNTSFAVRIEDFDGVDATDETSIQFTIYVGGEDPYTRNIGDDNVMRIVKLTSDDDAQVTQLWAVYDRSEDIYGMYPFDSDVSIGIAAKDTREDWTSEEMYNFRVESEVQNIYANDPNNLPYTEAYIENDLITLMVVSDDMLNGSQIIYSTDEPIQPYFGPSDEVPPLDALGITSVGMPMNLQPPTVFNNPVTLVLPCTDGMDVGDLKIYMHNGTQWVYACSSFNTGSLIQPGGEGWIVPGSLKCHNDTITPTLEVQVYHFTGIQAGFTNTDESPEEERSEGGSSGSSGGCFIDTASCSTPMSPNGQILHQSGGQYLRPNVLGKMFTALYERYTPYFADRAAGNEYLKVAVVLWMLWPAIGAPHVMIHANLAQRISVLVFLVATGYSLIILRRRERVI